MKEKYYAAIDLGTNSCRLVIADQNGNYLYNQSMNTRLGEGMSIGNCFTPEAFKRGIDCLKEYGELIARSQCQYRAIATAACRMATNGAEFVKRVEDECGVKLEVIDGHEEARLNLLGAIANADNRKPYLIVYDIGGGSTEVTLANRETKEILHTVSIPWGARNASEKFGLNDYNEEKAQSFRQEINRYMDEFKQKCDYDSYQGKVSFVATSSTPLRLSSYINNKKEYNREAEDGSHMNVADMDRALCEINQTTESERAKNIHIGSKRAPIFIAGSILLKTIYDSLGVDILVASFKSAKDSIIQELIQGDINGASE